MFIIYWKRSPKSRVKKAVTFTTKQEADRFARDMANDGLNIVEIKELPDARRSA